MSRSYLKNGKEKLADLLKADEIDPSWRTGEEIINYYVRHNENEKAYLTGEKYYNMYPENLGGGKPYEDAIDYRLEDFITAFIYEKKGKNSKAKEYYDRVVNKQVLQRYANNSLNCLVALAMKKLGRIKDGEEFIREWMHHQPDSKLVKWFDSVY
jgi:hypothetical protein